MLLISSWASEIELFGSKQIPMDSQSLSIHNRIQFGSHQIE